MRSTALYYPYFVPRSDVWLASALLWWDCLYFIWPEGIQASSDVVRELMEKEAIKQVDPTMAVKTYAPEFIESILVPNINSFRKSPPSFSQSVYLHTDKVDPLIDFFDSNPYEFQGRYRILNDEFFQIDKAIEYPYMSFLAGRLAENPGQMSSSAIVDTVTDDENYLQYLNYGQYNNGDSLMEAKSAIDQVALVTFRDVILELRNFKPHQLNELLAFREANADARRRFRKSIRNLYATAKLTSELSENDRSDLIVETANSLREELYKLEGAIKETTMQANLSDLGLVISGLPSILGGPVAMAGTATTVVTSIAVVETVAHRSIRKAIADSPVTYLYEAKKNFGKDDLFSRTQSKLQEWWYARQKR